MPLAACGRDGSVRAEIGKGGIGGRSRPPAQRGFDRFVEWRQGYGKSDCGRETPGIARRLSVRVGAAAAEPGGAMPRAVERAFEARSRCWNQPPARSERVARPAVYWSTRARSDAREARSQTPVWSASMTAGGRPRKAWRPSVRWRVADGGPDRVGAANGPGTAPELAARPRRDETRRRAAELVLAPARGRCRTADRRGRHWGRPRPPNLLEMPRRRMAARLN